MLSIVQTSGTLVKYFSNYPIDAASYEKLHAVNFVRKLSESLNMLVFVVKPKTCSLAWEIWRVQLLESSVDISSEDCTRSGGEPGSQIPLNSWTEMLVSLFVSQQHMSLISLTLSRYGIDVLIQEFVSNFNLFYFTRMRHVRNLFRCHSFTTNARSLHKTDKKQYEYHKDRRR